MIKAIIFDYGGVISKIGTFKFIIKKYALKFNIDYKKLNQFLREIWYKARINEIPSTKFWEELANYLKISKEVLRKDCLNHFGFNKKIIELAKKLKPNYKLAILSNQIEDWMEEVIQKYNLNQIFDIIVTSYKSKIAKPDIKIFEEIIKKLNVKPEEIIFIDDHPKNIPSAQKIGMKTILFKNIEQTKQELKSFGVKS